MGNALTVVDSHGEIVEGVHYAGITARTPAELLERCTQIAKQCADVIDQTSSFTIIGKSRHVNVEGWTTCASLLGVMARESQEPVYDPENKWWVAHVDLIKVATGEIVGHGSAICEDKEKSTANQRRSMAVTRATGKACRLSMSWILKLAGYSPTPAEEMSAEGFSEPPKAEKPKRGRPKKPTPPPEKSEPSAPSRGQMTIVPEPADRLTKTIAERFELFVSDFESATNKQQITQTHLWAAALWTELSDQQRETYGEHSRQLRAAREAAEARVSE